MTLGQTPPRMPKIPHSRIKQHYRSLEDVETSLIVQKRCRSFHRLKAIDSKSCVPDMLDEAIYPADKYQKTYSRLGLEMAF